MVGSWRRQPRLTPVAQKRATAPSSSTPRTGSKQRARPSWRHYRQFRCDSVSVISPCRLRARCGMKLGKRPAPAVTPTTPCVSLCFCPQGARVAALAVTGQMQARTLKLNALSPRPRRAGALSAEASPSSTTGYRPYRRPGSASRARHCDPLRRRAGLRRGCGAGEALRLRRAERKTEHSQGTQGCAPFCLLLTWLGGWPARRPPQAGDHQPEGRRLVPRKVDVALQVRGLRLHSLICHTCSGKHRWWSDRPPRASPDPQERAGGCQGRGHDAAQRPQLRRRQADGRSALRPHDGKARCLLGRTHAPPLLRAHLAARRGPPPAARRACWRPPATATAIL